METPLLLVETFEQNALPSKCHVICAWDGTWSTCERMLQAPSLCTLLRKLQEMLFPSQTALKVQSHLHAPCADSAL